MLSRHLIRRWANPSILSNVTRQQVLKQPAASICHKDHIDEEILRDKPAPWPYDRKCFTWFHKNILRVDRTVCRFDENSVVICVEGPMACGKHEFAKELAEQLGMRYYAEPTNEPLMVEDNGFDYRTLNWLLPESAQYVDQKMFYLNPTHRAVAGFIFDMYLMKYFHYLEGLTHLFNTGQGVVHERSPFSDFIFCDTLVKMGYLKKDLQEHYNDTFLDTHQIIHRPHVVIYLDIPAEESMRRFLAKSPDYVKNSPLMTLRYFQLLEEYYKKSFLPSISKHAEVLIYDWREPGHIDMVVEDIEKLDLVQYDMMTEKLEDWRHYRDIDFDDDRMLYSWARTNIYSFFNQPDYDKPSCQMSQEAAEYRDKVIGLYVSITRLLQCLCHANINMLVSV